MKLRKNDTVLIIACKDKVKKGKMHFAFANDEVKFVEGVNIVKE